MTIEKALKTWLYLVERCERDEAFRLAVQKRARFDYIWFFNTFFFTYDPRKPDKIIPFQLYPYQQDFLEVLDGCYQEKENLLVEKSRDMGFSWLVLGYYVWIFVTENGFSGGLGSRKAQLVDQLGNMKSLMERCRFMLNFLPWFMKNGYNRKNDSKLNLLMNPSLNSTISGEAGDEIGRGDRTSIYVLDEFAFVPRSAQVLAAVSQTTDCIVFGSTPNGRGNEFARIRFKTDTKRFTMHWTKHPNKTREWYEKQKRTMDETTLAQEIDIDYSKSAVGRVYKFFDIDKHANEKQEFNPSYPLFVTADWGIGDPTSVIFLQDYHGVIKVIDHFEIKDKTIDYIFQQKIFPKLKDLGLHHSEVAGWYGDPDGRNRNIITGESIASFIYDRWKISLRFKIPNLIRPRVMSVRTLGEQNRIIVDKELHFFIECFENYIYPNKESGENEKPVHNWASHAMSALEYYTSYEHGMDKFHKDQEIEEIRWL